jgi:hypothetical protein
MAGLFDRLRAFAQTRNGKIAVGGTAVAGAAGLAVMRRPRAGGDPEPGPADGSSTAAPMPPYLQTTGTSGANTGDAVAPLPDQGIIDMGQFEDLLTQLGRQSDALEELINKPPDAGTPPPNPSPVPTPNPPPTPPPTNNPQPAPAPGFPGTMRRGSKGDHVRQLQQRLNTIGFGLAVDGVFGPQTEAAVRHFQSVHAPPVDGIVGPKTWAALWRWPH